MVFEEKHKEEEKKNLLAFSFFMVLVKRFFEPQLRKKKKFKKKKLLLMMMFFCARIFLPQTVVFSPIISEIKEKEMVCSWKKGERKRSASAIITHEKKFSFKFVLYFIVAIKK